MNAETVLRKAELQRQGGEKGDLLRGLSALLITTPVSRKRARNYLENAISYIEGNPPAPTGELK